MKRPLILAAIVAMVIGLFALGAAAVRDDAPSTHAQGAATSTPAASPSPAASPTASPSPAASPTASPSPAASPTASPSPAASPTASTTTSSTPTCTNAMLGPNLTRTAQPKLAADCDVLLRLRYKLSRPDTLNWGDATATLTSGERWDGVTVTPATPAVIVNGVTIAAAKPARVTGLELEPYAFRHALTTLATLDALVDLDLKVYTTTETTATPVTPTTPTTTVTPATTATTLSRLRCTTTTLGGSRTAAANRILALDCDTLLSMKSSLAGTATLNWSASRSLTSWDGVAVSGTPKRVSTLALSGKSLTGKIPTQLGSLSGLTVLNLSGNQLTGSIPSQIGDLTGLTVLDLSGNQLGSGPPAAGETRGVFTDIPTQIGNLRKLTTLNLSRNRLWGHIPTQLGSLRNLTTLNLSSGQFSGENMLTGKIPTQLGGLANLQVLNLRNNKLGGDFTVSAGYGIPTQLGNLTNLTHLWLGPNSHLTGPIPTQLGNLTKLVSLKLNLNRLSGPLPTQLGNLANLQVLQLSRNNLLSGSIPTQLGSLPNLKSLLLKDNRFSGGIPPFPNPSLTGVQFRTNAFTGCVPGNLLNIRNDIAQLGLPTCPTTTN